MAGTPRATFINLDTARIINSGVDFLITAGSYPDIAYNNTYDFQATTEAQ
jgi:carboxypeptidase D